MIKRLAQVFVLGLMLIALLLLGCGQEAEEMIVQPTQTVRNITIVEPVIVYVTVDCDCEYAYFGEDEEVYVEVDLDDLDLLARLIFAEMGSNYCSDKMQLYGGSVALNRVKHPDYPNTLREVVYQKGQYSCTWNGMIDYEYNQRAYDCAKYLLQHGSVLPENVVYQAQFKQGDGVYEKVQNMYFCYKGEQ